MLVEKKFKKILVANRGEIARRVFRTCKEMGIKTVAIYTEEEKDAAHVQDADEAYSLGSGPHAQTYLNIDLIIELAKQCQADAIHPGYGFLSENAKFASALEKTAITFIGPRAETMLLMGDKKGSKVKMQSVGVPVIPGYHGDRQEPDFLLQEAKKIGTPLLIKASAGGGGKGMRVVHDLKEFHSSLESAQREAKNSFGDDRVLLERYLTGPRHIEVQVMSDQHGQHFHFFERECSIQRRHQKIIEETPSVALDQSLRQRICQTAVQITTAINYRGAGTVEFILDTDGSFYFLEMNTRLQVEHPITEMVTGSDLVRLQIEVAQGQRLSLKQADIVQRGHSIEVRLCAEDPDNNFLPSIGKIHYVGIPSLYQTRLESAYRDGDSISINFDPMVAKLIVWAPTRPMAIQKMLCSLNEVLFLGVQTNREYLKRILQTQGFAKGDTLTHFIQSYAAEIETFKEAEQCSKKELDQCLALLTTSSANFAATALNDSHDHKSPGAISDPWTALGQFRNV